MTILYGILLILIMYILLWIRLYFSLDYIDRITINILIHEYLNMHTVMNCEMKSAISNMDRLSLGFMKKVITYMLLPFNDKEYYDKHVKGVLINGIYFNRLNINNNKFCNKLYWYHIGRKYNINTPDIYVYIDNKRKVHNIKAININKMYIAKPLNGMLGMGMKFLKGSEVYNFNSPKYIIQEYMTDCRITNGNSRCFRYITLYNGRKYILIERIKKNSKISTHPEIKNICHYGYCNNLSKQENIKMNNITNKLSKLHKEIYKDIFSIGWDIIISCNTEDITLYFLEGNIFHDTYIFDMTSKNKKFIIEYKREALTFYKNNKLL